MVVPAFVRFVRSLGELGPSIGQGAEWQVIAHEGNMSHDAIAAWRISICNEQADGTSVVASSPGRSRSSLASGTYLASKPDEASSSSPAGPQNPCLVTSSSVVAQSSSFSSGRCSALKLLRSSKVLQLAATQYELGDIIEEGTFSHVFVAKRKTAAGDEQPFNLAVKRLKSTHLADAVCEVYVLDRCRLHQNIVQLHDVFEDSSNLWHLVFDHAGRDLSKMLAAAGRDLLLPTAAQTRSVASHLCSALMHLHSLGLLHTDLNPGNVLVAVDGVSWTCRLADFGCAMEATALDNSMIIVNSLMCLCHGNDFAPLPPAPLFPS
jgi:hypothetical protein